MKKLIMKNMSRRLVSLFVAVVTVATLICAFPTNAFAATSGDSRDTTIYVTTMKWKFSAPTEESITLKQNQQTASYRKLCGNGPTWTTKTGYYGKYTIKVYKQDSETNAWKWYKTYYWNGGEKYTVKLNKANTKFKIVVQYQSGLTITDNVPDVWRYKFDKLTSPFWWVSSTNKIASYS